ncbi:hypothetical protein HF086_005177 [Spodoptera exigua]|uniref:Very-long-chain 3-oxoacyl-CoA synthase n=1 Tax=Spodoptera exigua TaxID=7107 RepID=A0A922MSQ6_SPOEX|nr:hypothetical protein HF086_005177 [Spodoptera exigua]
MAGLINSVVEKYNYVIHDLADPRTADWWGVSNPLVGCVYILSREYNLACEPVDYSNNPRALRIQFCIVFTHNIAVFFYECNYPKALNGLCALNSLIFIYLFGKFYIQSYKKENAKNRAKLENKKSAPVSSDFGRKRKFVEKSR